jgi:hypothetical protein
LKSAGMRVAQRASTTRHWSLATDHSRYGWPEPPAAP